MASLRDIRQGFGNRAHLDKVDKLRALGISSTISLPQLVVVGDQSAGKSSVLESLTGFHFPRAVNLCTRHATEIICRREAKESIIVSIHPAAGCDHEDEARAFRREISELAGSAFADIFAEAAEVMGIKREDEGGSAFSRDVLRVEISGQSEENLTIIDVPGIFEHATPGVTTDGDIDLVKDMVRGYIREPRTIILAVVPCNVDIATQTILKYAADADPEGKRTLGVLTKPDLAIEVATKHQVVDLVRGKRRDLQLGYCIVRNRGADDTGSAPGERDRNERSFFAREPWTNVDPDRLGIPALKRRLQDLLSDRTRSELPNMMREIKERLAISREQLDAMGLSRGTADQQRAYLANIAARYEKLKNYALDAYYGGDILFEQRPEMKLITRMRELNEQFSKLFYERAHTREFAEAEPSLKAKQEDGGAERERRSRVSVHPTRGDLYPISFQIPTDAEIDVDEILSEPFACPRPLDDDIKGHIQGIYLSSRGYELGTFGTSTIPMTFREQAKKWPALTRAHVSNAILVVHHFIAALVRDACPDDVVHAELWGQLLDPLTVGYRAAMDHTDFILGVELSGRGSLTVNPDFEATLKDVRAQRTNSVLGRNVSKNASGVEFVKVDVVRKLFGGFVGGADEKKRPDNKKKREESTGGSSDVDDSDEHDGGDEDNVSKNICEDIHAVLYSFYGIARSRFVDTVCVQAVDHFLLNAAAGPLNVLGPQWVLGMSQAQLGMIAGEDAVTRVRRERLEREVADLKDGLAILKA